MSGCKHRTTDRGSDVSINFGRIAAINVRLDEIVKLVGDMAKAGTANAGNSRFDALMDEQRRLTDEVRRIHSEGRTD